MSCRIKIIYLLLAVFVSLLSEAQTVKEIEVAQDEPYTDHISLVKGSNDMDLMVKFIFDESANTLTVSLISYKNLFVFESDVRYSRVVRFRKLRPNRLPYVVDSEEKSQYKMTKSLRKSFPDSKRKHVFKRWIDYERLQPQPTDFKMVNDYIECKFDILNKETSVVVTLRDVLMMEQVPSRKKKKYNLFFQTDLKRMYEITIRRDPCFGNEEAIAAFSQQTENIEASYRSLRQHLDNLSAAHSNEGTKVFQEMRALLLEQYSYTEETSACPEIQSNIEAYNSYVDSIRQMRYDVVEETVKKKETFYLDADYVLAMARKIDNHVSKWLLTKDIAERNDLEMGCTDIIKEVEPQIRMASALTDRQARAVSVFNRAKQYFYFICGTQKDNK